MTAVASPPSFQPLPKLGWNSDNSVQGGLNSMSTEEVTRMFIPRKGPQRSNSSSSISSTVSTSSSTSNATVLSVASQTNGAPVRPEADREGWLRQKKPGRGLWGPSKSEPVSAISNARPQPLSTPSSGPSAVSTMSTVHQPSPILPSQNGPQSTQPMNGVRSAAGQGGRDSPAVLALLPMNGTFERKQISVPIHPPAEPLRIGRQTNAKTVPLPINGYFDSKVLSRQHAEIWADSNGRIWIRDVKSSNGTFVNGVRLSPENRDSEPHELREHDMLELGIDIVSEDQKSIVHHKVSAKVEHAGFHTNNSGLLDLNFGDIDPGSGGGLMGPTFPQHMAQMRGRVGSQGSMTSNGRMVGPMGMVGGNINGYGQQRHLNAWLSPVTIEQVVKRLTNELKQAKQQSQDLHQTTDFFTTLLTQEPGQLPPKVPTEISPPEPRPNGVSSPSKGDPMSPFSQPPAPPPQQPLPEKPDMARSVLSDIDLPASLKRIETERPRLGIMPSPARLDSSSSDILKLVDALTLAKEKIDSQGDRVKQLEDLLKQERKARESAEERARRLLDRSKGLNGQDCADVEEDAFDPPPHSGAADASKQPNGYEADDEGHRLEKRSSKSRSSPLSPTSSVATSVETLQGETKDVNESTSRLQNRLDLMVHEMDEMKLEMEKYKRRAEEAEKGRIGLAEMVDKIRNGDANARSINPVQYGTMSSEMSTQTEIHAFADGEETIFSEHHTNGVLKNHSYQNGKPTPSVREVQAVQQAVASVLAQPGYQTDRLAQCAPYASMLGVVLIGVGIMTYLNGWQKIDR